MRLLTIPVVALAGFLVGCNKTPEGGTPGGPASFKLSLPTDLSKLKPITQGTSEMYEGSVDRGAEFKKDVKIKVEGPDKLKVKVSPEVIKATDGSTKFNITVETTKDTPVGEHTIKVTGTPDGGSATTGDFKVKVNAP
jgi:uncharacterized membrane protein